MNGPDQTPARWTALPRPGPSAPRQDAYLPWSLATNLADGQPDQGTPSLNWVWLLIELQDSCNAQTFHQQSRDSSDHLWVAAHHASPPKGLERFRFCTARVSRDFLHALQNPESTRVPALRALVACIKRFETGFACAKPPSTDSRTPCEEPLGLDRQASVPRVVVGVIDDGLAFANERFCRVRDGVWRTRLISFWDQGTEAPQTRTTEWGYGQVFGHARINAWLQAATDAGRQRIDETRVYHDSGYKEARPRVTHGTHVMDLACGADPRNLSVVAPAIVAVQMPPLAVADTSCAKMTSFMLDAMLHVLKQADAAWAAEPGVCPCVINLSMGNIAGPHDGSSILESAVDALILARRTAGRTAETDHQDNDAVCEVVLPEGNSLQSQTHAWAEMERGDELALSWTIKPDDGTSSFLEVWARPVGASRLDPTRVSELVNALGLRISVKPPANLPACFLALHAGSSDPCAMALTHEGMTLATLSVQRCPANGRYPMALLTTAPTAPYGPWKQVVPAGNWEVKVEALGGVPFYCNVYVQRDDTSFGRRGKGRQGVLDDGNYRRINDRGGQQLFDELDARGQPVSFVRRAGTINALATGKLVRVAGGLLRGASDQDWSHASRYSSVDIPLKSQALQKSRELALTEDSDLLPGVLAAGSASGSWVLLSGTSMAAPQLTRQLALHVTEPWRRTKARKQSKDPNDTPRDHVWPYAELDARSRRRRGRNR